MAVVFGKFEGTGRYATPLLHADGVSQGAAAKQSAEAFEGWQLLSLSARLKGRDERRGKE